MPCSNKKVETLLITLESDLRDIQLWSDSPPSVEAISSCAPFACDQMPFEGWLQFIFIPKMSHILKHQLPMPTHLALSPAAEQSFSNNMETTKVLVTIREIDRCWEQ